MRPITSKAIASFCFLFGPLNRAGVCCKPRLDRSCSFRPDHIAAGGHSLSKETANEPTPNGIAANSQSMSSLGKDTFDFFSQDVTKVLKELRPSDDDGQVPLFMRRRRLTMTNAWTLTDWADHSTRMRFIYYATSFPRSRLLRRILPQFGFFMGWTLLTVLFYKPPGFIPIPLTPLSLVSTFVAALLTMRSNTGLNRLAEGRVTWGNVVNHSREIGQLIATKVYPKDPQMAFLMARHASIFAWVMKSHMREKVEDIADVVRAMLSPVDAEYVLSSRKAPAAILTKLRQGFQRLGAEGKLSLAEEMMLDRSIERLDDALMTCERIRASPIPPLYTSHTSRLLMFYLAFLPLALRDSQLSAFATTAVAAVVGYTMFGLDEISHLLEMPFKVMPLRQFSKFCMMDVSDALLRQPASLDESLSQLGDRTLPNTGFHNQPPQPYW